MPEMTPVISSNLAAVGYDAETSELHVEFHNGAVWVYAPVPPQTYSSMMAAPSQGRFFASQIKGRFEGRRI